jgi:hypothetical protein
MWLYNEKEFNDTPEEYQGFVYQITELDTGKNILVKRTFGNQRSFPKIPRDLDAYELVLSPTGALTLVVVKKSNSSSKKKVKRTIKERFFAFVRQKVRCRTVKQNSNLKRTYYSAMSTTIILSDARYTRDIYPKTYRILR